MSTTTTNNGTDGVRPTKAIIIAAGLGKRLRPFTDEVSYIPMIRICYRMDFYFCDYCAIASIHCHLPRVMKFEAE